MQLIYRGHIYTCPSRPIQAYRKPQALNWRFHAPGEDYSNSAITPDVKTYHAPRGINWRYQQQYS